jgi:hypothetical protein
MREMDVDPKVVADLMGHDVNVNLNVYTRTPIETKLELFLSYCDFSPSERVLKSTSVVGCSARVVNENLAGILSNTCASSRI